MKLKLEIAILAALCMLGSVMCKKLKVSLYYEALCPFCKSFITDQLYPAFQKIGSSIKLEFVPYGNAEMKKVSGAWVFECQHGDLECKLNKLVACGASKSKDQANTMEFVNCIETEDGDDSARANACSDALGIKANVILKCARGAAGTKLLAKMGTKTYAVKPEIEGVPTLTFNNKNDEELNDEARQNFLKTVCKLLHDKPEGCQ